MKVLHLTGLVICALLSVTTLTHAEALGTAFTYRAALYEGEDLAQGNYDFYFKLYDSLSGGVQVGTAVTNLNVPVDGGQYSVVINFGTGVFDGTSYWLEVHARTNGAGSFTPLTPRQWLSPTPYALYALNAGVTPSGIGAIASAGGTGTNLTLTGNTTINGALSLNGDTVSSFSEEALAKSDAPNWRKKIGAYPTINVKDYGATGDGVTDDTDALEAAVFTDGHGKSVYLPPGIYLVSRPIQVPDGTHLFGDVAVPEEPAIGNGCIIRAATNFTGVGVLISRGWITGKFWHYSLIENLRIDCNGIAQHGVCIHAAGETAAIRRVFVKRATKSGFWFTGPHATLCVENCVINYSGDYAVRISLHPNNYTPPISTESPGAAGGLIKFYGISGDANTNGFFFCNVGSLVSVEGLKIEKNYGNHVLKLSTDNYDGMLSHSNSRPHWTFLGGGINAMYPACTNFIKMEGSYSMWPQIVTENTFIYGPTNMIFDAINGNYRADVGNGMTRFAYAPGATSDQMKVGETKIHNPTKVLGTPAKLGVGDGAFTGFSGSSSFNGLDVSGDHSAGGIMLGADSQSTQRGNNAVKIGRIGTAPYSTSALPVSALFASNSASASELYLGGSDYPSQNGATRIQFYTANAVNTVSGTKRWEIGSSGHFLPGSDNTYDIGASGSRPRDIYVGSLQGDRAVTTDVNKKLTSSSATATELGYLSGVTSALQTQLNGKQSTLGFTPVNLAGDTMTGALRLPVGSASTPSLANASDTDTGILFPGSGSVAFSTDGSERMKINNAGGVGIGSGALGGFSGSSYFSGLDVSADHDRGGIMLGAEFQSTQRGNNAVKIGRIGSAPYSTSASPVCALLAVNSDTTSELYLGGGYTSQFNGATRIQFYTANAVNTATGTKRWEIGSSGHFLPGSDNSYDIGASGSRPRNLTLAGSAVVGGLATAIVNKTSNYTLTSTDSTVLLNGSTLTATLPTAVGIPGRIYTIKLIAASTTGTVQTTSSQTIDGAYTYSLAARYKFVTVQSDGANWYVIGQN